MMGVRGPTGPGPGQGHDLDCKQSGGWQDWQAFLFLVVALVFGSCVCVFWCDLYHRCSLVLCVGFVF